MTDIVERLRRYHKDDEPPSLYDEAADEIERLRAALVLIAGGGTTYDSAISLMQIARRALERKP